VPRTHAMQSAIVLFALQGAAHTWPHAYYVPFAPCPGRAWEGEKTTANAVTALRKRGGAGTLALMWRLLPHVQYAAAAFWRTHSALPACRIYRQASHTCRAFTTLLHCVSRTRRAVLGDEQWEQRRLRVTRGRQYDWRCGERRHRARWRHSGRNDGEHGDVNIARYRWRGLRAGGGAYSAWCAVWAGVHAACAWAGVTRFAPS